MKLATYTQVVVVVVVVLKRQEEGGALVNQAGKWQGVRQSIHTARPWSHH